MTDTRTRLLKGAVWIALGSMIANGIGFLNTIIMARLLVPEDFGLVAICAAVMAILLSLAEMPLSETLVRHDAPTEEHPRRSIEFSEPGLRPPPCQHCSFPPAAPLPVR